MAAENIRPYAVNQKPPLSGSSSAVIAILMSVLAVCLIFASYLYLKKKKNLVLLETMHFQNPSYGLSHLESTYHPNELTPGEHQYENPTAKLVQVSIKKFLCLKISFKYSYKKFFRKLQHPDGKLSFVSRENELDKSNIRKLDIDDYDDSDSDTYDRIDMKAQLIK